MKYIKLFEDYEYEEEFEVCPTCDCNPCKCDEMSHEEEEFDEDEFGGEFEDEEEFAEKFEAKKAKPDFLDIDKDGNKKESMKKAAKDAKEKKSDKKEDKKEEKGLSAAQKKLPAGLRAAIARKAAKGKAKD